MKPGWYPDPDGGESGQFRWFDGQTWHAATNRRPDAPEPERLSGAPAPVRRSWRLLVLSLVAVAVVVISVAVWAANRPVRVVEPPALDSPTELPPLVSPTAPAVNTSAPVYRGDPRPCPVGAPAQRARHPDDGRVHGGGLSFPRQADFRPPRTDRRYGFARDVAQQTKIVQANTDLATPGWAAQLVVGRLSAADGFDLTARLAAGRVLSCLLTSDIYRSGSPVARVVTDQSWEIGVPVPGRGGALLVAEVLVRSDAGFPGDRLTIAVVPDRSDWSFFVSAIPIGSADLPEQARRTLLALETS